MDREEIKAKLDELGVEYDGRKNTQDLADLLEEQDTTEEAENEAVAKAVPETVPVTVLRDFWRTEDDRVRKGTVIEVSKDDAMDGIENGTLKRVK